MPESKTIKPEAKEWFRAHRREYVGEKMLASRLYPQDEVWWLGISERLLDNDGAHVNLLCENGDCAEPRFHHLRVPVSFIAENRDDLDFRADKKKFWLYLSANPHTLFREERGQRKRGQRKIDFSPFKIPPTGGESKRAGGATPTAGGATPASGASARVFVFIDLENVSKEDTSDVLTWLSGKAGFITEGAAFTAKTEPGAYKTWAELLQMHNIKVKRALPGVKDSADAKLIVEWTRAIFRLKKGDCTCIVGSDGIYQAAAEALGKGIRVLHFGKSKPKWDPKDARYRFFLIGDPAKWRLP